MHMLKPVCDDNMKGLGSPEDVQEKPHEALQVFLKSSVKYRPAIHHHKSLQHVHVTLLKRYKSPWHTLQFLLSQT